MSSQSKRQETKQRILSATEELVYEKGCRKTTLNDIMEHTGLSKGAIYHYVSSKDELFAWILKESFEAINERFFDQIKQGNTHLEGPLSEITKSLPPLQDPQDASNQIFIYLLGQSDVAAIQDVVGEFYERTIGLARQWIASGQEHGVIPMSIDADKTADLFMLLSFGLRMRSAISTESHAFGAEDFSAFMTDMLRPTP